MRRYKKLSCYSKKYKKQKLRKASSYRSLWDLQIVKFIKLKKFKKNEVQTNSGWFIITFCPSNSMLPMASMDQHDSFRKISRSTLKFFFPFFYKKKYITFYN